MIDAETALLTAVRDRLRDQVCLNDHDGDIELDDEGPAIAGDEYWTIQPAGVTAGPRNNESGVVDLLFSVRVCVLRRSTHIPRDRRREVFIRNLHGVNDRLGLALKALHFNYVNVINVANTAIAADRGASNGGCFLTPLRGRNPDSKPKTFTHDVFDSRNQPKGDPVVGVKRGITFTGARFMSVV